MKKLLATVLMAFPFIAWAANDKCGEGLDECRFISSMCYTITDKETNRVVDETCWKSYVPITFNDAIAGKYLHMDSIVGSGVEAFLKASAAGGLMPALQADEDK